MQLEGLRRKKGEKTRCLGPSSDEIVRCGARPSYVVHYLGAILGEFNDSQGRTKSI